MKKRADGRYCKQIKINGKTISFYGKTIAEINKKIIEYNKKQTVGLTFEEVAEEWKNYHFETLEYNTLKQYKPALKQILENFGDSYIKEINSNHVDAFIKEIAQKGYAQKTVKTRLLVLNLIFKHAVIKQYIESNPCQYISIPKNLSSTKRELPSEEQIQKVKDNIDHPFGLFAYFILYSGLRRGEALALKYKDIDFNNKTISVNKSVFYIGNQPNIKSPKTEAGNRKVILLDCLADVLPKGKPNELIFKNQHGEIIRNAHFNRLWQKYQKDAGITITPHQLRHAFATILFEAGIDVKDAQELLGHTTIQVTRDIYTHISKTRRIETAEKLNHFVSQNNSASQN